jgi:hypothetical protein
MGGYGDEQNVSYFGPAKSQGVARRRLPEHPRAREGPAGESAPVEAPAGRPGSRVAATGPGDGPAAVNAAEQDWAAQMRRPFVL